MYKSSTFDSPNVEKSIKFHYLDSFWLFNKLVNIDPCSRLEPQPYLVHILMLKRPDLCKLDLISVRILPHFWFEFVILGPCSIMKMKEGSRKLCVP